MKIKRKVQKTLPQLIEWIEKNRSYGEVFTSDKYNCVHVTDDGILDFVGTFYNDTFTVEVEEEITEDTKFDLLLDHFTTTYGHDSVGDLHRHKSINDILEENDDLGIATNSIHTFDRETNTFNLIWRNGKLVE